MHNASLDVPFETVGGARRVLHSAVSKLTGRHNDREASSIPGCCTLKPDTGSDSERINLGSPGMRKWNKLATPRKTQFFGNVVSCTVPEPCLT